MVCDQGALSVALTRPVVRQGGYLQQVYSSLADQSAATMAVPLTMKRDIDFQEADLNHEQIGKLSFALVSSWGSQRLAQDWHKTG